MNALSTKQVHGAKDAVLPGLPAVRQAFFLTFAQAAADSFESCSSL